ncbi:hypothetical protein ACT4US_24265, partial [Bacillus sp. HC-Mk]
QVAGETSPYAQSDWNASKRQEWSNKLIDQVGKKNAVFCMILHIEQIEISNQGIKCILISKRSYYRSINAKIC